MRACCAALRVQEIVDRTGICPVANAAATAAAANEMLVKIRLGFIATPSMGISQQHPKYDR